MHKTISIIANHPHVIKAKQSSRQVANYLDVRNRPVAHHRKLVIAIVALVVFEVGVQIGFPGGITTPMSMIGGEPVYFKQSSTFAKELDSKNKQVIQISVADQVIKTKLSDIGVSIDSEAIANKATNYSFKKRFLPFSLFYAKDLSAEINVEDKKFTKFVDSLQKYGTPAQNASVVVDGQKLSIKPSKDGEGYSKENVLGALEKNILNQNPAFTLNKTTVKPDISDDAAQQAIKKVQARVDKPFKIVSGNYSVDVSGSTIASWLEFTPNKKTKTIDISYDENAMLFKILKLSKYVYVAQTPTSVVMINGKTQSKLSGSDGQALVISDTVEKVKKAMAGTDEKVEAVVSPVSSKVNIERSYTKSSAGLQALIEYWASQHSGSFGVSLKTMDGSIVAKYNGDKQFTSASIYKMYVAYNLYRKVASGDVSLNTMTSTGYSVSDCASLMIRISDNACAVAIGEMIGWQGNDAYMYSQGYTNTTLKPFALHTTANDTAKLLYNLQAGTLIQNQYRSTLLGYMKAQIYRSGIPAGSSGTVADKVGFLDEFNHDAAIVYGPSGTYVLVVMTSSSSFYQIADLAEEIANLLE